jgi:hypothetical protein
VGADKNAVSIVADKLLGRRRHGRLMPDPKLHPMKLTVHEYLFCKYRHRYVGLF